MVAEPEMTVVEHRAAALLEPHIAVVAAAERMMSVVLHSGTQSAAAAAAAAGNLAIKAHDSRLNVSFTSPTVCLGRAILETLSPHCLGANCILSCPFWAQSSQISLLPSYISNTFFRITISPCTQHTVRYSTSP